MREQFVFLKPDQASAIRKILPHCRLVVSKNYPRSDVNRWIFSARRSGVPTLLLVDGPLEWANVHSNPSLKRPGAEGARALFAPIIHDAVASIGPEQSKWIESQNADRGLTFIEYANRRIQTPAFTERAFEFDFLLTTAKTAAFSELEKDRLGDALERCAEALRPYGARLLVRLLDATLESRVREALPSASFETKGSFTSALSRAGCVIGTPSSVLLEAMHHRKPTATLLFRPHPLFYQTGWQIDPQDIAATDLSAMLRRDETGMRIQDQTLAQNLSNQDFYANGLAGPILERMRTPRPLDEADLAFEYHVRESEKRSEARFTRRVRRFAVDLGLQ